VELLKPQLLQRADRAIFVGFLLPGFVSFYLAGHRRKFAPLDTLIEPADELKVEPSLD
jgi:hypothetical protein